MEMYRIHTLHRPVMDEPAQPVCAIPRLSCDGERLRVERASNEATPSSIGTALLVVLVDVCGRP